MKVEIVSRTEGVGKYAGLTCEQIISAIARHGIIKEDNGKLVKYLMTNAHWSPLDMINFTFEVETSRAIGRQILRHASIKFQEHSQRYSDKVSFEPVELREEHPTNRQSSTDIFNPTVSEDNNGKFTGNELVKDALEYIEEVYFTLIKIGVAKECARNILPECTTTVLSANGTLRSWLSFLNVRLDHHAQKECQELALLIGEELERQLPSVFATIDWRNGMFM